jgi:hypothetical protein
VAWLLGEGPASVTSSLVPKQRQRQRFFAHKLLSMRRTLRADGSSARPVPESSGEPGTPLAWARELHSVVNSALASVAQYVQELLDE